jgi:hypothetical protein
VIGSLPMVAAHGFGHGDHLAYGCEVLLAAGDLASASDYADRLAQLPFNREESLLGLSRRLKVDALAGHFDAVLRDERLFRDSWERCGRPVVPNLASSPSAIAMVHGILGDDAGRAEWLEITKDLLGVNPSLGSKAWAPTFDAIVALHRGDFPAAVGRLAADLDDQRPGGTRARSCTDRGMPRYGRRPPYSTTTPKRWPGSTEAGTRLGTIRSQPPWSRVPRRSPPAIVTPSSTSRSPSPSSAAPTSRQEPAG